MRDYRILIIDDNVIDAEIYSQFLAKLEPDTCHVQFAEDGASGLDALRNGSFDCVLLDFNLPAMGGVEFLHAAAVDGELPCAVVLVTGHGKEAVAAYAMKHGAQDYLVKDGLTADKLCNVVRQAVVQAELRRRIARSLRDRMDASLKDLTAANHALQQEAAIREVTERELRSAKEAAEQASLAKTRFVAMVTHELRTPLNSILGYAQLLRLEEELSPRQDTQVVAMMQAGQRLLEMLESVLDFANVETDRMELHPKQASLRDLMDACLTSIGPMATERALALLAVTSHDAPRHFFVDPIRLRQVLLTLVGNAVKYTEFGSVELRVLAGTEPGALRIEVVDTGSGIDEASRGLLFMGFERLVTVQSVDGMGLGLAVASRIVKLMGGEINYSPTLKGGSLFWFELPDVQTAKPQLPEADLGASSWSALRVLLVDDIKINLDIIGSFLGAGGHAVVMAQNGEDAIRLTSEQRFDLILMDVRMPGMDGLEAVREIRKLSSAKSQVPILALTAYSSLDEIATCIEAGMDGHVPKPVNYETLMQAIDRAMAAVPTSH